VVSIVDILILDKATLFVAASLRLSRAVEESSSNAVEPLKRPFSSLFRDESKGHPVLAASRGEISVAYALGEWGKSNFAA